MHALPKFNTDSAAVREFLWSVGTYWLEQGIDGWRLDVPNEINDDAFCKSSAGAAGQSTQIATLWVSSGGKRTAGYRATSLMLR